ncbi:MAG: signal peptide peptidase SppA [Gammaproteobacteria bacterium]|nr:signal peptide peptidase SppA [Gammaproteobacteria bacterium]
MIDDRSGDPWLREQAVRRERGSDRDWERGALERVLFATLREQRSSRRWGIFFKCLLFLYLFALLYIYLPSSWKTDGIQSGRHTALIDIRGVIADDAQASADNVIESLRDAYKNDKTSGIILRINSPGGSPVQAGEINDEIGRLRKLHPDIPVYAVVTDICASGGYYIAVAADKIFADKASMVGSIGVLMNGFGFVGTMDKLGVERRLLTAGKHKGIMDPFSPMKDEDRALIGDMLESIHQQFIDTVKQGRGDRLKVNDDTFSGLIWTGEQAVENGLIDGLHSADYVARVLIKEEHIVDFTHRRPYLERLTERLGSRFLGEMLDSRTTGLAIE